MTCVLAVSTAFAQTSSTTTTTTGTTGTTGVRTTTTANTSSAGTIVTYAPDVDHITFRTETSSAPVKYYYSKTTTVVDPAGKVLTLSALKPNMPAKVYYVKEGDRMVVSKVELVKPVEEVVIEKKETTTTTTTTP